MVLEKVKKNLNTYQQDYLAIELAQSSNPFQKATGVEVASDGNEIWIIQNGKVLSALEFPKLYFHRKNMFENVYKSKNKRRYGKR